MTASGKTLQVIKVAEILKKMEQLGRRDNSLGVPLVFYPKKQLTQKRAKNQDPVYLAQMDLRVDLSEVWAQFKKHERILIKLVVTSRYSRRMRPVFSRQRFEPGLYFSGLEGRRYVLLVCVL